LRALVRLLGKTAQLVLLVGQQAPHDLRAEAHGELAVGAVVPGNEQVAGARMDAGHDAVLQRDVAVVLRLDLRERDVHGLLLQAHHAIDVGEQLGPGGVLQVPAVHLGQPVTVVVDAQLEPGSGVLDDPGLVFRHSSSPSDTRARGPYSLDRARSFTRRAATQITGVGLFAPIRARRDAVAPPRSWQDSNLRHPV